MIRFVHPEAFLLALPVLLVLRGRFGSRPLIVVLRALALLAVLALLAQPYAPGATAGRDLVLVVDRSASAPVGTLEKAAELAKLARANARPGDRIGLVTFGRDTVVEAPPQEDLTWAAPRNTIDADGTEIAGALEQALALLPEGRQGSLLLVSDGESNGRDPLLAAAEAARRGIRIDAVPMRREQKQDVAVEEVSAPSELGVGEPFLFTAFVRAEQAASLPVELWRDGKLVASGPRALRAGSNRITFKDRITAPGTHRYEVKVASHDRVPENDKAQTVVRVEGRPQVCCVTPQGREDRLTRSLSGSGLHVTVVRPEALPATLDRLGSFRAVILEDIPLADLPAHAARTLRAFVDELGGGLLMTGGRASFGVGGWYRSQVEEVLPVSLEIRQEQRRFGLAMAIALDRSGSMAVSVGNGLQKMDLANLGTCAAIEMLGRLDTVAVAAVDTAPHEIVAPTSAEQKQPLLAKVRTIESSGGGIFVDQALEWGLEALAKTPQASKHLVVFADAADSERPAETLAVLPKVVAAGITISVIGLGKDSDQDAELLREVAAKGGGRVFFSADPNDLPRVFAQETTLAARSSVREEPLACRAAPGLLGLGKLESIAFPTLGGVSIAWKKPDAQLGIAGEDEDKTPVFTFWQHGLGRAAAFLGEADGALSGGLATWTGYGDFFSTVARWLAGNEPPEQVFAEITREGRDAVLTIEVEKGHEDLLAKVAARVLGPDERATEPVLERVGERKLVARFPLSSDGVWQATVRTGTDGVLRTAPIMLPYSPDNAPVADREAGERLLRRLAAESGGSIEPAAHELFAGPRESVGIEMLDWLCAWIALGLLLAEISVRRLELVVAWRGPARVISSLGRATARLVPRRKPRGTRPEDAPPPARDLGSMLERAQKKSQRRLE